MYSKLSTQAIILKSEEQGEKDVFLSVFTREFGFVFAKATGVRTQSSRLRFALQPMTLCFVSLVHGKTGWILTNATFLKSYYFESEKQFQKQTIIKILHLLGRLYIGEQEDCELFDFIEYHIAQSMDSSIEVDNLKSLEIFIVFKLLEKLGYIEKHEDIQILARADMYTEKVAHYIRDSKEKITPFINSAIRTSGL
jgi:recombinational DNA repair protein (RecF pathway)